MNFKLWNWRKYEACDRRSGTGKLDYVLENMIEESEKYDVYDCFFKDNACNDKASNMEWPWNFAVDDESILIIDKFHYFIRAVLEKIFHCRNIF